MTTKLCAQPDRKDTTAPRPLRGSLPTAEGRELRLKVACAALSGLAAVYEIEKMDGLARRQKIERLVQDALAVAKEFDEEFCFYKGSGLR